MPGISAATVTSLTITNVYVVAPYFVDLNDLTGNGASGDYLYF